LPAQPLQGGAVTCEHCGSLIQGEARERPAGPELPEAAQTEEPTGRAPEVLVAHGSNSRRRWLYGLVPTVMAYAVIVGWSYAQRVTTPASLPPLGASGVAEAAAHAPQPPPVPQPASRSWPGLLLVPAVHGSSGEDLIALLGEVGPNGPRWLGALAGATGELLWQRPLAPDPELGQGARTWVDGMLVVTSPSKVFGLNPESGETSWVRNTGAPPSELCAGQGFAGLRFPNERFVAFAVATGSAAVGSPEACKPLITSRSAAPNFALVEGPALDPPLPGRSPLRVQRALVPHQGSVRVLLGSELVAASARVAVASRKAWLWSARLGRADAADARLLSPPLAAVRNERVVVPYVLGEGSELRLASLELGSGRLVWDRSLSRGFSDSSTADAELRISRSGLIYFSSGLGRLWALESDGRPIWTLGAE
jgi:putative pyrroloquinoline-quinone binding quinoprotein